MSDRDSQTPDDVNEKSRTVLSLVSDHRDLGYGTFNTSLSLRGIKSGVMNDPSSHSTKDSCSVNASRCWTGDEHSADAEDGCNVDCVPPGGRCQNINESRSSCYLTCGHRQINRDAIDCGATAAQEDNHGEMENATRQSEIHEKRVEGMSKTNSRLRRDLKRTIQTNLLLERCLTCPYVVNDNGEITFPGKKDLDKRFDVMFREVEKIKEDLKIFEDDELLVCELKSVLNSPLPKCFGNCHGNVNEK